VFVKLDVLRQTGKSSSIAELCEIGDMIFSHNSTNRKIMMTRLFDKGKSGVEVAVYDESFIRGIIGTRSSILEGGVVWCDECSDEQLHKILEFVKRERAFYGMIIHVISIRTPYKQ
jgi:hypothetical protein